MMDDGDSSRYLSEADHYLPSDPSSTTMIGRALLYSLSVFCVWSLAYSAGYSEDWAKEL